MKKFLLLITFLLSSGHAVVNAQSTEVINKKGYRLTIINQDPEFSKAEIAKLVKTFFEVYPKLEKEYNSKTSEEVTFIIDTAYDGVAETGGGRVTFSSKYMTKHPADIDVVTHEVMHIIQDYGDGAGPGWLTEGIADYARFKFGVDNKGAGWQLPDYKPSQNYDNAYRITARFLVWIEKKLKPDLVKSFDEQLRSHTFTDESWKKETGKTVDELWVSYSAHPQI
ncbi:secretory protein [Mucilaginibacter sp. Bleaf8]|uniref:basic secretory protein-like protein n=1 Tax=Mucilaginibacter sp. Bleaf8 TaxID=2834430 RepID=UPI001BCB1C3C|nr:basic secretory protein-like protein [Mucilaginibacter sp. Bleaf8]MBS7563722.1 secretory protein [Mucilaginibacter sp. Bleaf8]